MTTLTQDSRLLTASGLEVALAALPPVYASAARQRTVPLTQGTFTVTGPFREPVLLTRLRKPLADRAVVVLCTVGTEPEPPPVVFAPFSGQGTLLPLWLPPDSAGSGAAGRIAGTATVHVVAAPHCHAEVPPAKALGPALEHGAAAELVECVLLEGLLARITYLATMEKQRMIRQAREIAACRHIEPAFSGALDSLGRDLGVPRLPDEDDARYRGRLTMFTSWRLPTRQAVLTHLNGRGDDNTPNTGLPALFGITARFRVVEEQNTLSLSTRLVGVGADGPALRARFHDMLRAMYLLDLDQPVPGLLPPGRARQLEDIRRLLATEVDRPAGQPGVRHLAPTLAAALARLVRLVRALGDTQPVTLRRAHVDDPDPLHELGLGATLDRFGPDRLEAMATAAEQAATGSGDIPALARSLEPRPFAEDPLGRWLMEPCGLRTVYLLDSASVHVSTLPVSGLTIDGPANVPGGTAAVYRALHRRSGTSAAVHVLAAEAAERAPRRFAEASLGPVPEPLVGDGLGAVLRELAARPGTAPPAPMEPLLAADLLAGDSAALATAVLDVIDPDQVIAYPFTSAELALLGSGDALRDAVAARMDALSDSGFYTVRGMWDAAGDRLLVLAAVCLLPGAVPKPGEAPPSEFRWSSTEVPMSSSADPPLRLVNTKGGRIQTRAERDGLALVVCLGYARRGLADPYEVRMELPEGVRLDRDQYGYVMNLLESLCPLGIEINTFELRRNHVTFDDAPGTGPFVFRDASRTYHRYRRRRSAGADDGPGRPG
ncbi:hypothetical protein [Streptomyces rhizosphaericus]|uniref:Uncharacterized protein n=1 Tax=Streptomyces rhizosphaericus TaxID=114699 RepID=A0A6G4A920_9ACTN|nr:hypothetical protein [Streptomyces rhizosphaericus]NEW69886.1 hypothetical protein [Streptomyces rhizosphaericus]